MICDENNGFMQFYKTKLALQFGVPYTQLEELQWKIGLLVMEKKVTESTRHFWFKKVSRQHRVRYLSRHSTKQKRLSLIRIKAFLIQKKRVAEHHSSFVMEDPRLRGDDTIRGALPRHYPYDTNIMENTMTNNATVSPTPSTIR